MNDTYGQRPLRLRRRAGLAAAAFLTLLATMFSAHAASILVNTPAELQVAAAQARPGDTLVMRDGVWNNADLLFAANGSNGLPVTLRAQTLGAVHLTGLSRLRIAGHHLVVDGLVFTNGYRSSGDIISFQDTTFLVANFSRITNCTVIDYNPPDANSDTKWVTMYGFSNRVDNCYFRGKSNLGSTIVVTVSSETNRPNYHVIAGCHFGFRPPLGQNGGETIRVGESLVSLNNSRTTVENNFFDQCNGDAEIISSKSCENIYRRNTFIECEGALSLRHGNRCTVEGNYFFGRGKPLTGGVRIVGEDHKVYNNYFADLTGTSARSPLSIMQGIFDSPLNGYAQVFRATVAFNTFVGCTNSVHLGLAGSIPGTPPQVTTLPPVDCIIANNISVLPAGKHIDQRIDPVNFTWQGNLFFGASLGITNPGGITIADPLLVQTLDGLWRPGGGSPAFGGAQGSFPYVTTDIEGQGRPGTKDIGADQSSAAPVLYPPLRAVDVGPLWMRASGTVLSWANPADIVYGTPLGSFQLSAVANVPGNFAYTPAAGTILRAGAGQTLRVVFTPNDLVSYSAVTQTVTINVLQALPALTWLQPTNIPYGTPLGAAQLSATATIPGAFAYNPPAGTVLNVGPGQPLVATFTPADFTNYATVSRTNLITVLQGTPVVTWPAPAPIESGTPLGPLQLNASANVPGSFTYAPPAGTVLSAGSAQSLTAEFMPSDPVNYATVTRTVLLDVTIGGRFVPIINWTNPADITFGTSLSVTQLNATASVPGSFVYVPPAGTVLPVGNGQPLTVNFTPANPATHTNATKTVQINVAAPISRAYVRVAYLIPTNRIAQPGAVSILRDTLRTYQSWFRAQMEQNGFGPKTFAFETEADEVTPKVHVVTLAETDSFLRGDIFGGRVTNAARAAGLTVGSRGELWWLIPEAHMLNPDGTLSGSFDLASSFGGSADDPGWAVMSSEGLAFCSPGYLTNDTFYHGMTMTEIGGYPLKQGVSFSWFDGSTLSSVGSSCLGAGLREMAEALGLDSDYRNDENFDGNLTGFGFRGLRGTLFPKRYPYNHTRLSYGAALALNVNRYFNPGRPVTDDVKPVVTVTSPGAITPVDGLLRLNFTATDGGGLHAALLSWEKDDERTLIDEMLLSGTAASRTFATPYFDPGRTNRYTLSVYDAQGNKRSVTASVLPGATVNRAPQPFLIARPAAVGPGEDMVFDASKTFDPEHSAALLEVEWDFDGDGLYDTEPSTVLIATNRYYTLGHRLARLRVTDAAGDQAVSAPVAVSVVPCAATVSPLMRTNGYAATTSSFTVRPGASCEWSVINTNPWITITAGASGIGTGVVSYALTENPEAVERVGHITAGDAVFTVVQRTFACTFSLSPTARFHGFGTGNNTIRVTTQPGCAWVVLNTNSWVTITGGASGIGTGTVAYAISDNRVSGPRSGTIGVGPAGGPLTLFTLTQWGTNCSFVVSPLARSHSENSETGSVSISTASGCGWQVVNTNGWIALTTAGSGSASGSFGYSVQPNTNFFARTGLVEVAGQVVALTQAASPFALDPLARTHGSGVEVGMASIVTGPGSAWSVINTSAWITVLGAPPGGNYAAAGSGTFTYAVAANPLGSARSTTLRVGPRSLALTQLGVPCAYQISIDGISDGGGEGNELEAHHGEGAEVGLVDVSAGPGCPVTFENSLPWVRLLSGAGGTGPASIIYSVDANPGNARAGFVFISGVPFQINQRGGLRLVRPTDTTIGSGGTNWVPIVAGTLGTENTLGVSVCFETNLLSFVGARVGDAAFGGALTVDSTQASLGRVGLSLAMPPGWSIAAGQQTVIEVGLRAAAVSGRPVTTLALCETPTARVLRDVLGQPVPAEFQSAVVRIIGECTPGEALDAPLFAWTVLSGGAWACQTNVTHDGEDALASPILADSGDSYVQATFIGPGTLSWWWKVSSEAGSDRLRLYLDGSAVSGYEISGEVDWEQRTYTVPAGSHVVRFRYNKNGSVAAGLDRAWVDDIEYTPAPPIISAHPTSRSVDLGSTVSLGVTAAGSPPVTYQWYFNNLPIPLTDPFVRGAATATLTISNIQFSHAGQYSVRVGGPAGFTESSNALVTVVPVITLPEAVDAPDLAITAAGNLPWRGQSMVSHDGQDAAQSGAIADSQTSGMVSVFTGPGTLTWWWKVSSQAGSDRLRLYLNGSAQTGYDISGEIDWQPMTFTVPAGNQTVEFRYSKNGSTATGQDRGWVDELRFAPTPAGITAHPAGVAADSGGTVVLTVTASGAPPLTYQWRRNGEDLLNGAGVSGANSATLTLTGVQPFQSGDYSVVVANGGGTAVSSNAVVIITPVLPLAEAIDATQFAWTTTGTPAWTGQSGVTRDGVDAARSGAIGHSGDTRFSTTVTGPGTVSFWWKVSCEPANDRFRFYIAGSSVAEINGEVDWQWRTFTLGSGSQTLEWRYNKSSSVSMGQDRAWVDQIVIATAAAPRPPVFGIEPTNLTVVAGSAVSFRAVAGGTAPITYQWRKDGTNLLNAGGYTGVTTTNLALASAQTAHVGTYSVIASNAAGVTASTPVTLAVITAPVITSNPPSQHVIAGSTVNFAVSAIGQAPLFYQWQFNGVNLVNGGGVSGATNATLTLTAVNAAREGLYSVIVSNAAGIATSSSSGSLSTWDAARTGAINHNETSALETTLTGPGTLTFWWKTSAETNDTLTLYRGPTPLAQISGETEWRAETNAVPAGTHTFRWEYAKNASGTAGADAGWLNEVQFTPDGTPVAPTVAGQPASRAAIVGDTITIEAAIDGSTPLFYEWRFNGAVLQNSANVSGAQTPRLALASVQAAQAGAYSLRATNAAGTVFTADALLTVTTPPLVVTTNVVITTQPASRTTGEAATTSFTVAASGPGSLAYQWRFNGTPLVDSGSVTGASTATLTLHNLQPHQAGNYSVTVSNAATGAVSANAALTVLALNDAVNTPYWPYSPAGYTGWVAQAATSRDGWAARSGVIPDNQNTRLETWIDGPGTLSFWWKVSSQASADQLRFYIGTNELSRISGEVDWQQLTFPVPAGTQLLKWRYSKDASGTGGQDAAWVDQIAFTSTAPAIAPAITGQPVNVNAVPGDTLALEATVTGSAPLSYQWRHNGQPLLNTNGVSGARTPRLTLAGILPAQAGAYSLVASNAAGPVTSADVLVSVATVLTAPSIAAQPASRTVSEGSPVSFTVSAIGAAPLEYQWRFNGEDLANGGGVSGAQTATLNLSAARLDQIGNYSVTVSNAVGGLLSANASLLVQALADATDASPLEFALGGSAPWTFQPGITHERGGARLTVSTPPAVASQPVARVVVAGGSATFNVAATGTAPLGYQWRLNGVNLSDGPGISGANTPTLSLSGLGSSQAGAYSVRITNAVGSVVSSNATLTVNSPPSITAHPAGVTVGDGSTLVLTVGATGTAPLGYQWRYNGTNIVNGGSISGATSSSLTILNAQPLQSGLYSVVVSNLVGTAVSSNAAVVVRAALAISEALNADYLFWNTSLAAPWLAQSTVSHDGTAATRSGLIGTNQSTWLETTVQGPGTVRFWWKVSSQTNSDYAQFYLGGVLRDWMSGEVDWRYRSFDVPGGLQTLRWAYVKDGSGNSGQDRAWLDEVEFVPSVGPSVPVVTKHPTGVEVAPGATVSFTAEAVGTPPLSYRWTYNGIEMIDGETVSGASTPVLNLSGVDATREGTYQLVVRNNYSVAISSNAFLHVLPVIPIPTALDIGTTNMLFITGGNSAWFGQDVVARDRVDAVQSGRLLNLQTNWMETEVVGPIAISFWWKVSSQTNSDRLRFYVNGVEQGNISGEVDWRWRTFDVNFLTAKLRWAYTKDASGSAGRDAGWIDEITTGPMAPIVTNGPNDITYGDEGSLYKLRVETAGTPPFGYQWRLRGTNLIESTNFYGAQSERTLTLSNARPWQSGVYDCLVSNAAGVSLSETGHVVIIPARPLPPALNTPTWIWRTGGDAWWVGERGESHDGVEAARTGTLQSSSGSTWMETTLAGAGQLRFWWKVSSRTNQDFVRFYINDVEQAALSGTPNWMQRIYDLEGASNVVRWVYTRNGILTNGQNRAMVDEVFYGPVPPVITNQPLAQAVDAGSTVTLSVRARGTPPFSYRWRLNGVNLFDGANISGAATSNLVITGIQLGQAGNYSVVVSNAAGGVVSANAAVTVSPTFPLDVALDTTGLTWTTSGSSAGNAVWIGQPAVTRDGVDAARIMNLPDSGSASMQTTVTGPALVSFWWKVSSQAGSDVLRFFIGSSEQAAISGEVDWVQRSFTVPAGSQTLRWTYSKNGSVVAGQDRAWVDQVVVAALPPAITTQPVGASVDQGDTVQFSVAVDGTPPLTYRWRLNGVNLSDGGGISGATTATLRLTGVQPAQAGNYSVVVSNSAGSATSASAALAVATIVPLAQALDTTGMTWTTGGDSNWVGQTAVSFDGVDAARSGRIADDEQTSLFTTLTGPGTVSFRWKVSSQAGSDRLRFYVNGSQQAEISGEVDWTLRSQNLGSGTQNLEWRYTKNGSTSVGQDRAWVDQVAFGMMGPSITQQPTNRAVEAGATVSFSVAAAGTPPFFYQWLRDGSPLSNGGGVSGATTSNLTLTAVQTAQAGVYSVIVSNAAGSTTSAEATLTVSPIYTLAQALDTTGLTWTTNGTPPWVGQGAVSRDGVDAARSGAIGHSGDTRFSTTVTGPGQLAFWWKVSSQAGSDRLRFYVDGSQVTEISGEIDWTLYTRDITSGNHTIEWRYTKNGSTTVGQDRGWVDQVTFGPAAPQITQQPASQTVDAGSTVTLTVGAVAAPPVSYQWRYNGSPLSNGGNISGANTTTLTIDSVLLSQAGNYSVVVTSGTQSVTSANAALTVTPVIPLADALDAPGLVWSTGGSVGVWSGQSITTHDGIDAAQSGTAGASQYTFVRTTVTGPGTLNFWWRVSSEADRDNFRFMLNGVDQIVISGEVNWRAETFAVPAGTQELQWRFSHNSSGTAGQDRAWLDQVAYTAAAGPSPLLAPIPEAGAAAPPPTASTNGAGPITAKVEINGTKAVLTWDARPTKVYQVVYKDSLSDPQWTVLDGEVLVRWKIIDEEIVPDSVIATMEDILAGKSRYYRVVEY